MKRLLLTVALLCLPTLGWAQSMFSHKAFNGGTITAPILFSDGTAAAPSITFANQSTTGMFRAGTSHVGFSANSSLIWGYSSVAAYPAGIKFTSGNALSFGSDSTLSAAGDVVLLRDAAATLQLGVDAATATAQTISAADSTGAGNAGAMLTLSGGAGGAGGAGGTVAIADSGTKPTCAAGIRGSFWYEAGGAGVADTFEVCAKQAAGDTYAWHALATIP